MIKKIQYEDKTFQKESNIYRYNLYKYKESITVILTSELINYYKLLICLILLLVFIFHYYVNKTFGKTNF